MPSPHKHRSRRQKREDQRQQPLRRLTPPRGTGTPSSEAPPPSTARQLQAFDPNQFGTQGTLPFDRDTGVLTEVGAEGRNVRPSPTRQEEAERNRDARAERARRRREARARARRRGAGGARLTPPNTSSRIR